MNPRPCPSHSGQALIACAVVLAAIGAGLLTLASPHAAPATNAPTHRRSAPSWTTPTTVSTAPPPAPTARATPTHTAMRTATGTTMRTADELPPPGSGPGGDAAIQRALDAATPPDLPVSTTDALVALGRHVWTAETTGSGRQQWPGYFPAHRSAATWTYTRFRIQAATARRDHGTPDRAVVRLVWAGTDPTGAFLDDRTATVTFTRTGAATWTPVR